MNKFGIMTGLFLSGLLLVGIGGGVAFAEYTSFSYGGEKVIGGGQTDVVRIEQERKAGQPFSLALYDRDTEIVEDSSLDDGHLVFEIEYYGEYTEPYVESYTEEGEEGPEEFFYVWQDGKNELGMVWKLKDEVLDAVKERKVYDYKMENGIKKITVYMSSGAKYDMISS